MVEMKVSENGDSPKSSKIGDDQWENSNGLEYSHILGITKWIQMEDHPPKIHGNLLLGVAPLPSLLWCGPRGRPNAWSTGTGGTELLRFPRQRGSGQAG